MSNELGYMVAGVARRNNGQLFTSAAGNIGTLEAAHSQKAYCEKRATDEGWTGMSYTITRVTVVHELVDISVCGDGTYHGRCTCGHEITVTEGWTHPADEVQRQFDTHVTEAEAA